MRKSKGYSLPNIGLSVMIVILVAGCAPQFIANPQLQEKLTSIKTVAIMPPSVRVYQLSVEDKQLVDHLTAAAAQHVAKAVEEKLKGQSGFIFTAFPSLSALPDTSSSLEVAGLKDELEDTQALFEAVGDSVMLHAYGPEDGTPQPFREKRKNFDYSLGPDMERLAKLANADALLFVSGIDYFKTAERKSSEMMANIIMNGVGGIIAAPIVWGRRITILNAALVDGRTGALLWYSVVRFDRRWSSLTDPRHAADMVEEVLTDFPISGKPSWKD